MIGRPPQHRSCNPVASYIDIENWPRRDTFEFFRTFDKPYFNVCTRLDAAKLKPAVAASGVGSFSLACHFLALRWANETEAFRLRLEGGRVRIHEQVGGSTTVLRADESIAFAVLGYEADYVSFARRGAAAIRAAQATHCLDPGPQDAAVVHITTLPWVHFSSFSHARNWGREDSVPKLAFGRLQPEGERLWLPFSVEVHHALMDGLHVGRYIQGLEAAFDDPQAWLASG